MVKNKLKDYGTGATRSADAENERFDLISPFFLRRLAVIMAEGVESHGQDNWRLGIPKSVTFNHMLRHLNLWHEEQLTGNKIGDDDHLCKVVFGCMAIAHYEAVGPELNGTLVPLDELKKHPGVKAKKKR